MQQNVSSTAATRQLVVWLALLGLLSAMMLALLNNSDDPVATFRDFSTRFLGIFIEAAPFLLLGAFVSGLLEVYVTREDIVRWIPRNPFLATAGGAMMGFAFPVCECGVVPVTRRLFSKGLPMSVGVAFLLAAPVMNPIVLVSTAIAFGFGPMLLLRFAVTAVVAISVGTLFALAAKPHETLRPVSLAPVRGGGGALPTHRQRVGLMTGLYRASQTASNDFFEMGRFLVIGCLLAAGTQTFISQDQLLAIGEGPLISVLVMQLLAFLMSVCSTVDAILALGYVNTFTSGSVLAFLTFGPMVDFKSTMMFTGVFRPRVVLYLIALPLLMTMLISLWINLFFSF